MEIKTLELSKISPAEYNPRKDLKPGDLEYERIKNSVSEFGLVEPLVVNKRNMVLVGGHQRYKVLTDLGKKEAEAVMVDLDDAAEKTLNIALNKIEGDWDYDKLQEMFTEMDAEEISRTSFSKVEIDDIIGTLEDAEKEVSAEKQKNEQGEFELYLSFSSQDEAEAWLDEHGIKKDFPNTRNIVLSAEGGQLHAIG